MKESLPGPVLSEFLDTLTAHATFVEWLRDQGAAFQQSVDNSLTEVRFRWDGHFWSARFYPNGNFKELVWA